MSKTIDEGDLELLLNYGEIDSAIRLFCPELLHEQEIQMLCDRLKWARHNLRKALEKRVGYDGEN